MTRRAAVFFYVQHLLGIGHLARASRIADALADDGFEVTVVTGGPPVAGFPGAKVRTVALPSVRAGAGFSGLEDMDGRTIGDDFKAARRDRLIAAFQECRPDVVVLEAFPFGRRQMRFELLPLIEAIGATAPKPLLVSSLRDILQERAKPGRNEETADIVERHFDCVMVHGDPGFARIEETFPLAHRIADRAAYTGLVAGPPPPVPKERVDVLVSAGGGAAGAALVRAAAGAARLLSRRLRWMLITGPNLPPEDFDNLVALAPANLSIVRFRDDFASLLAGAALSVSQAGYNTVGDLLQAHCRALLIPFAADGETEQTVRAARLERLGLARVIEEDGLSSQRLARAVEEALTAPPPPAHDLDLDGARGTARLLQRLLERRTF